MVTSKPRIIPIIDHEAAAKRLVDLYVEKVTAEYGQTGRPLFRGLMRDDDVPEVDLRNAVSNFGTFCDQKQTPASKRPSAKSFLTDERWKGFVGGVPSAKPAGLDLTDPEAVARYEAAESERIARGTR